MSWEEVKDLKVQAADQRCSQKSKKTFFCSVCNITLSSLATMEIHLKGVRHMKRSQIAGVQNEDMGIVQIQNPESRKKIPIKLTLKISDSSFGQTIVGLDYITEYIPVSNDEMEPHYSCVLCNSNGQSNCMFSHLTGRTHRLNFARNIFGEAALLDVTQAQLAQIARDYDERKSGFETRIETILSDEEYPWPSGKAPWLIQNGGTGVVPPLPERKREVKPPAASERKEGKPNGTEWRRIRHSQVRPPSSTEEAVKMITLAGRMLELGMETRGASSIDTNILKVSTGVVLNSLL